ncbi:MAG TPA: YihY/virulence factor BrkB family protein [bacterium]|nr:YihY/virulence factor BrkB family protein [bacterium]
MVPALWHALQGFRAHRGFFLAAGLSFYLLICVIPMLFLVIALAGFVLTSEAATQAVLGQLGQIIPVYRRELRDLLGRIVETRRLSGVLGTVILILFSTQLFAALRLVMNDIFGIRRGRGFLRGMVWDLVMVLVMGVLFLASIAVTDLFFWARTFVLTQAQVPREWIRWMFTLLGVTFSVALFFIVFRYFPNRRVRWGAALLGALLASLLWEAAKQLFRWYILSFGVYDQVYGPLGIIVALTMFAYYTGVVVILGAEYAAALEARWRRAR